MRKSKDRITRKWKGYRVESWEDYSMRCVEKLTTLEDLEEQELLIKLPCRVGDKVYESNISRNVVFTYKITAIVIGRYSINYNCYLLDGIYSNLYGFNEFALGKTVFLTREEAEKVFKEREVENE